MALPAWIPKSSNIIAAQSFLFEKSRLFGPVLLAITDFQVCLILEGRKLNPKPVKLPTQFEPPWCPLLDGHLLHWVAFIQSMA